MKRRFLLPVLVFVPLLLILAVGLTHDPAEVPSPLIGKPAPDFYLPQLDDTTQRLSPITLRGKPWLLSVWASWCATCVEEHPLLNELAQYNGIVIVGIDYKDERTAAMNWLGYRRSK